MGKIMKSSLQNNNPPIKYILYGNLTHAENCKQLCFSTFYAAPPLNTEPNWSGVPLPSWHDLAFSPQKSNIYILKQVWIYRKIAREFPYTSHLFSSLINTLYYYGTVITTIFILNLLTVMPYYYYLLKAIHQSHSFQVFLNMFLFFSFWLQHPTQDTILHLIIMTPYVSLGCRCNSFLGFHGC